MQQQQDGSVNDLNTTTFGFPSAFADMEKALASEILKTETKGAKPSHKMSVLSSEEEEEPEDNNTIRNVSEANH